jgi:tol-pal system protein YbgF
MRSTLAFLAGILVGFLLAWTSGPAGMERVGAWWTALRTEVSARMPAGLDSVSGGLAVFDRFSRQSSPDAWMIRRPVHRFVRMIRSDMIVALPEPFGPGSLGEAAPALTVLSAVSKGAEDSPSPSPLRSVKADAPAQNATDAAPEAGVMSSPAPTLKSSGSKKDSMSPVRAADPKKDYARALKSYEDGRHAEARERFTAFLSAFPGHPLAPNALYWSGETWYAQARYDRAAENFAQVVQNYPRHAKSPDALLKLAYSAMRQGRLEQAGVYLRQLESRYPDSPASRLGRQARSRLQGQSGSKGVVLARG